MIKRNMMKARLSLGMVLVFAISLMLPGVSEVSVAVAENGNGDNYETRPISELEIGDMVVDNTWLWQFRTGENYTYNEGNVYRDPDVTQPVTWLVVAKDHYDGLDPHVTLLSWEVIGRFMFDNSNINELGYGHWGESGTHDSATMGIRPWLNSTGIHEGEGFYQAFSDDFKERVLTTTIGNSVPESGETYTTEDKVFIPSATELYHYKYYANPYPYFKERPEGAREARLPIYSSFAYWTRTPEWDDMFSQSFVTTIERNGYFGFNYAPHLNCGVRPVINLCPDTPVSVSPNRNGVYKLWGEKVPVESVEIEPEEFHIGIGNEMALKHTVLPHYASDIDVTYKSDNEDIASVDDEGVVSAVSEGTAVITVSTNDGGFTAESTVHVLSEGFKLSYLQLGDKVVDKSFDWQFRSGVDYTYRDGDVTQPVAWEVVAKDHYDDLEPHITLISELVIGLCVFDNSTHFHNTGSNHWGDSGTHETATRGIRPWLNSTGIHEGEGFYQAFSDTFKNGILTTPLPNKDREGNSYTTYDKVFIPSSIELGGVSRSDVMNIGNVFPAFARENKANLLPILPNTDFSFVRYMTRSPRNVFKDYLVLAVYDGSFGSYFHALHDFIGVRAIINMKPETPLSVVPNSDGAYEIQQDSKYNVYANPEQGGTVSGAGLYGHGEEVTVTADAANGYKFVNWTVDGHEVSDEPEYTFTADIFTAEAKKHLIANFAPINYGDVNNNGRVGVHDAILVLRHIVGLTVLEDDQLERAKVGDGDTLTVNDAILILRYVVGLIDEFPVIMTKK